MADAPRTVILTRPARASQRFAAMLEPRIGGRATILIAPILEIVPVPVERDLAPYPTLIFTSENALHALGDAAVAPGARAYCVGDRTAEVAEAAGFRARSAAGDVEALKALLLEERPPGPWLHLSGAHQRGDLAEALSAAGHPTERLVVYRQDARPLSGEAGAALLAGGAVLPVFSPRSARLLSEAMPSGAPPPALVAISEATAAAWPGPAAELRVVPEPDAISMVSTIGELLKRDSHC